MKWIKPTLEEEGKSITRRRQQQANRLGWYEYIYGSPYAVPRVYLTRMAENLRFGADTGVQAHYAEI